MLKTNRYKLIELDDCYINDYFIEFNESITKYQYLEPFLSIEDVKLYFDSSRYEQSLHYCLHYLIIDDHEFIGSVIVQNLLDDYPEIGIWIKSSKHKQGIGKEVLTCLFEYLNKHYKKEGYLFSIDYRNKASLALIQSFKHEFAYHDSLINESFKKLEADVYVVNL